MRRSKLRGSIVFPFSIGNKVATTLRRKDPKPVSDGGVSERSLIGLFPDQKVPCVICDCPGTISRVCISSLNVVCNPVAAVMSIRCFTMANH